MCIFILEQLTSDRTISLLWLRIFGRDKTGSARFLRPDVVPKLNGSPRNKCLQKVPRCVSNMHEPALEEHIHYFECIVNGSGLRRIRDNRRQGVKYEVLVRKGINPKDGVAAQDDLPVNQTSHTLQTG